jgi:hypothetical protein
MNVLSTFKKCTYFFTIFLQLSYTVPISMFGGLNTIIVQKVGATTVAEPCHSDTVPVLTYYFRSYGSSSSF